VKSTFTQLSQIFLALALLLSPFLIIPPLLAYQPQADSYPIAPVSSHYFQNDFAPGRKNQLLDIQQTTPEIGLVVAAAKTTTAKESQNQKRLPTKTNYTIAVLGDSMIDVMGPNLPELETALKKYYPGINFRLLNYGVGASSMEYAWQRLTSEYTWLGETHPPLVSQNPDIVVIESFAYNHWDNSQAGLDHQWLTLSKIINLIRQKTPAKIVLAAAIAPDQNTLCEGIDGLDLPPDQKKAKAATIKAYLKNLVNFAQSQGYALADAYHPSLDSQGNGQELYINPGDHLHPSQAGKNLMSQEIAEAIWENGLI
jgi:hypothetical protein